jgi:hypothetical protein
VQGTLSSAAWHRDPSLTKQWSGRATVGIRWHAWGDTCGPPLTAPLGAGGAGKGGDAYGHRVWKMIRKSDGRAKHTSPILGVTLSGRDDHESLTYQGERKHDDESIQ